MIHGSTQNMQRPLLLWEKIALVTDNSIQVLELNGRLEGDNCLMFLLDALQRNPHNKVTTLCLQNCHLTNQSAQSLIEFVVNNKRIIDVDVKGNAYTLNIEAMLFNAIDLNRLWHSRNYLPRFRPLREPNATPSHMLVTARSSLSLLKRPY